jgi:hypothetical protein
MIAPAQTYVPQSAQGALWPHRRVAPVRPVGCMRGLGCRHLEPSRQII